MLQTKFYQILSAINIFVCYAITIMLPSKVAVSWRKKSLRENTEGSVEVEIVVKKRMFEDC